MKYFLIVVGAVGVGGVGLVGLPGSGPDFDRTIDRPPSAVYAAFASTATEGEVSAPSAGLDGHRVSARTTKQPGRSMRQEIVIDGRVAVSWELNFEAAGNGTRITAEAEADETVLEEALDIDTSRLRFSEIKFDLAFAREMDRLVDRVAAGDPIDGMNMAGINRQMGTSGSDSTDPAARRYAAERAQRAAVRPMNDARPMVDPDAAAEAYRRGEPNPNGRSSD